MRGRQCGPVRSSWRSPASLERARGDGERGLGGSPLWWRLGGTPLWWRLGGSPIWWRLCGSPIHFYSVLFSSIFCSSLLFFSLLFASLFISFLILQKRAPSCGLRDLSTLFRSRCLLLFSSSLFSYILFSFFLCSDSTKTIPALCDLEISLILIVCAIFS